MYVVRPVNWREIDLKPRKSAVYARWQVCIVLIDTEICSVRWMDDCTITEKHILVFRWPGMMSAELNLKTHLEGHIPLAQLWLSFFFGAGCVRQRF